MVKIIYSTTSSAILYRKIYLTPEDKKILAQLCRHEEIIYVEALKDWILFGYWVAMVGQGVGEIEV